MVCRGENEARRSPNKKLKQSIGSSPDFLSNLTDDLLLLVLSFLPANEAIRTSSLSRRWRRLPSLLPVQAHLLLGSPVSPDDDLRLPSSPPLYLENIERALESQTSLVGACEIVPDVRPEALNVGRWSEALARRGVRELTVDFRRHGGPDVSPLVRKCRSLFRLELRSCSLFPDILTDGPNATSVRCSFLTHLRLVEVKLSDDMLWGIASECKMLVSLDLIECFGFRCLKLGDARRLKELSFRCPVNTLRDKLRNIVIEAPALEFLDLIMMAADSGVNIVAPKLRFVHISLPRIRRRYFPAVAPGLWRILWAAADMSCLQLRGGAVDCLSVDRLPVRFSSPYRNLCRLYVNVVLRSAPQALCLAFLLQHFSILEHLNLFIIKDQVLNAEIFPTAPPFKDHKRRLEQAQCISDHLQFVTISGFTGEDYEMQFLSFILRRARVLKKMVINLNKKCFTEGKNAAESLACIRRASPKGKLLIRRSR